MQQAAGFLSATARPPLMKDPGVKAMIKSVLEAQETTELWDAPTRDECKRRMKHLGVPDAQLPALLALLTDPQSNIRPDVVRFDADLLECCTDALHDMGYPDAAGALRTPEVGSRGPLSALELGLAKARSDCVNGDGAYGSGTYFSPPPSPSYSPAPSESDDEVNHLTLEDIAALAVAQVDAEDRMEAQQAQAQAQEQAPPLVPPQARPELPQDAQQTALQAAQPKLRAAELAC